MAEVNHSPRQTKGMHFLPCVMLSRFGEGLGRDAIVWVWDKATGKTWRSKVAATARVNQLYRLPRKAVELLDGQQQLPPRHKGALAWERIFEDIEGNLGPILDRIISTARLPAASSQEMFDLLHAIIICDSRTPARMKEIGRLVEVLLNRGEEIVKGVDPRALDGDLTPHVDVPFDENRHLFLARSTALLEPYYKTISAMGWSLRVSLDGEYVICDYPFRWVFARTPEHDWDSPAPRVPNSMGMFPLSKTLLLTGESTVRGEVRLAGREWVAYHNTDAVLDAERWVYSHSDSFPVMWPPPIAPAYKAIYDDHRQVMDMTRGFFAQLAANGGLPAPSRFELVAPDEREH
jgi:hypothetical protein